MTPASPNAIAFRPLAKLKSLLVKPGRRNLRVAAGLLKGVRLELDLQHHTQIYLGLYETEIFPAIRRFAAECVWMVDVGAGAGDLSIYCLRQPACKIVHAIEPQESERALLTRNLALNNLANDPRLMLHTRFAGNGDPSTHIAIDTLDLSGMGKGFLKIDVDGFEVDVIESATQTLRDGDVDVLVEVHSEQLERDCLARLEALGYTVKIIPNAWWRVVIPEVRPIAHNRWITASKSNR